MVRDVRIHGVGGALQQLWHVQLHQMELGRSGDDEAEERRRGAAPRDAAGRMTFCGILCGGHAVRGAV